MITKISIVAGQILTDVENANRPTKLTKLPSYFNESRDLFLFGIGRLVRLGLILLNIKDGEFVVVPVVVDDTFLTTNDQTSIYEKLCEQNNELAPV